MMIAGLPPWAPRAYSTAFAQLYIKFWFSTISHVQWIAISKAKLVLYKPSQPWPVYFFPRSLVVKFMVPHTKLHFVQPHLTAMPGILRQQAYGAAHRKLKARKLKALHKVLSSRLKTLVTPNLCETLKARRCLFLSGGRPYWSHKRLPLASERDSKVVCYLQLLWGRQIVEMLPTH